MDLSVSSRAAEPLFEPGVVVDFEDFFENGEIALHLVGADGTILYANRAELALLGYAAQDYIGHHIGKFHADLDVSTDILARLSRGEKLHKHPARLIASDGAIKHVEITSNAQFKDGQFVNTRCFTVDVTALHHAEAEAQRKDAHLRQVLEALPAAIYTTDRDGKITYFNRAAVELAGREPRVGEDEWCVTFRLFTPDGKALPHSECPMATALKENRPVRGVEAMAQRPDGTLFPFLPFPTPLQDEDGVLTGAVNMLVDISERKQAESNQRMLLDELNHRVKNNMQMLHGLLRAAERETTSQEARLVLADAGLRVSAMAAAQQLLYRDGNSGDCSASAFLHAVCASAGQAFNEAISLRITAVDGVISNDMSMPLALILNELLTNAAKHGVGARGSGEIRVSFGLHDGSQTLVVEDDGPGFEFNESKRHSSGLGLVGGLVRQLGGKFAVESEAGARCTVTIPSR